MQCLDASIHHFGEAGVLRHVQHGNPSRFEGFASPSGGQELKSEADKPLSKGNQTLFVAEADQHTTRTGGHENNFQ